MTELVIQIEVVEDAAEEEVLADVTKRPLDLALGLGPIGAAGARLEAIMAGEIDEGAIVDDEPVSIFADDRGLHAIIKDRVGRSTNGLEGGDVAAQDALQVLVKTKRAQISRE